MVAIVAIHIPKYRGTVLVGSENDMAFRGKGGLHALSRLEAGLLQEAALQVPHPGNSATGRARAVAKREDINLI